MAEVLDDDGDVPRVVRDLFDERRRGEHQCYARSDGAPGERPPPSPSDRDGDREQPQHCHEGDVGDVGLGAEHPAEHHDRQQHDVADQNGPHGQQEHPPPQQGHVGVPGGGEVVGAVAAHEHGDDRGRH